MPETNPLTPMGPETALTVRLLYRGKPLPNIKVSFIPRGENLQTGFDARYEQKTDAKGRVTFTPRSANIYLMTAHYDEPKEKGEGYDFTKYSATLTLYVPQICSCCGG